MNKRYKLKAEITADNIDGLIRHLREISKKLEEGYLMGVDGKDVYWDLEKP